MEEKSSQKKAWETMNSKGPGEKAASTKRRKRAAKKVATAKKNNQWQPSKVEYLKALQEKALDNRCIVCGESRLYVLHKHHIEPEKKDIVILCANCHDIVGRAGTDELKDAHRES